MIRRWLPKWGPSSNIIVWIKTNLNEYDGNEGGFSVKIGRAF
jgi:hypothetical protein